MLKRTLLIGSVVCGVLLANGLDTASAQERPTPRYKDGKDVYERICQACHMPDAKGAVGAAAYPALAGNPKLATGMYPALVVMQGYKSMPPFYELNDEEVAAVTNYIRTNFGNHFTDAITAAEVKAIRPAQVRRRGGRAG